MAKKISEDFDNIRDSRLQYEKTMPHFGYVIIIVIVGLLTAVVIWGLTAHKTYIVHGAGTVISDNKTYIMSDYTGSITEMNVKEGTYVKEDDIICVIKSTDVSLQIQQLEEQIKVYQGKISKYNLLEKSIKDNTNYFGSSDSENSLYYNTYGEYKSKVGQISLDRKQYEGYEYTEAQIDEAIKLNKEKINEIYHSTLSAVATNRSSAQEELDNLNIQLRAANNGEEEYKVKATTSGIVHLLGEYKIGTVVQTAGTIGSIANEKDVYSFIAHVDASDIPLIETGDKVDIAISGLNETAYGTLSGSVEQIDSDVTIDSESGKSYFKIYINSDEEYLVSKGGRQVNVSNGMSVQTRIVYDEITYFQYVMECLGVLTR